jgi:hypothetical protein
MNSLLVLRNARLRVVFGWIDAEIRVAIQGWLSHLPRETPSLDRGSRLEHGEGARTGKHALGGADRRAGEQVSGRLFGFKGPRREWVERAKWVCVLKCGSAVSAVSI